MNSFFTSQAIKADEATKRMHESFLNGLKGPERREDDDDESIHELSASTEIDIERQKIKNFRLKK